MFLLSLIQGENWLDLFADIGENQENEFAAKKLIMLKFAK